MDFKLDGTEKILASTPQVIRTLLTGLPEEVQCADYGPETWSPHETAASCRHLAGLLHPNLYQV